jgi:hypothetical protein
MDASDASAVGRGLLLGRLGLSALFAARLSKAGLAESMSRY